MDVNNEMTLAHKMVQRTTDTLREYQGQYLNLGHMLLPGFRVFQEFITGVSLIPDRNDGSVFGLVFLVDGSAMMYGGNAAKGQWDLPKAVGTSDEELDEIIKTHNLSLHQALNFDAEDVPRLIQGLEAAVVDFSPATVSPWVH